MNAVKALFDQQYGFSKWKSLDNFLPRLRCLKSDEFNYLLPSEEGYCDTPVFACKFSQKPGTEHLIAMANEDGKLAIHDVNNKHERIGVHAHNNAIFDLSWLFQRMKIVTASGDHAIKLFDVSDSGIYEERTFAGHTRSVKTVTFRKDDPSVFATGSRDGNIILWDTRVKLSNSCVGGHDKVINNSHISKAVTPSKVKKKQSTPSSSNNIISAKSVTGLVFQDYNTLISCGAGDGFIKVWDVRKNYVTFKKEPSPKYVIPYTGKSAKNGYSSLLVDNNCMKLYANCLDNSIYCYNISTYDTEPVMCYSGHQNNTFYIKSSLSRDGAYLLSGSSDENAYIWKTNFSCNPLFRLTGHTAEVTCVAWSQMDETVIVTCSDDVKHKLWRIGSEDLPENWEFIGRGKTEMLPSNMISIKPKTKRLLFKAETDILTTPKKFIIQCEKCSVATYGLRFCENCNVTTSKRKRSDECLPDKRQHTDFGPRQLFSHLQDNTPHNDINKINFTELECKSQDALSSPTVNLPNFIMDGVAPHLNYSPPKKRSFDWLTRLRIDKSFKREMILNNADENNPKIPKLDLSPRNRSAKRCSSPKSPLLRYFKVTNNASKCERHPCSVKSHACNHYYTHSPRSSQ